MKTPQEFDHDLWTTSDGRFFVRVKATGDSVEVSVEVMRLLRAEEKRLRREITSDTSQEMPNRHVSLTYAIKHPLSLDAVSEGDTGTSTSWLASSCDIAGEVEAKIAEREFIASLTPHQAHVYRFCISGGMKKSEYAKKHGVSAASVTKTIRQIQAAAKKFLLRG